MLIHLGDNEFISLNQVVGIFPIAVLNAEVAAKMGKVLTRNGIKPPKSAVLTRSGRWVGSTISTEALAERGYWQPKPIRCPSSKKVSATVDSDEENQKT